MRSQTIYQVYSGNCDEENDNPGPVAWRTRKAATKIARDTIMEVAADYPNHTVETVKMENGLMRFNMYPPGDIYSCNWWYVVKVTLKD